MRPGLAPIEAAIAGAGGWHAWRGGLDGSLVAPLGDAHLERRLRDELAFWERTVRVPGSHPAIDGDFHEAFARWQRGRRDELAAWLNDEIAVADFDDWAASRMLVEIGGGPHPFAALGGWRWAASIDPLSDGYRACNLFPRSPLGFVPIAAPGEVVPLPTAIADVVACDNCLDHVADPGRVVAEIARLLVDGGFAWLLVDLRDEPDDLHPHPFTPERLTRMLVDHAMEIVRERVGGHASNPEATAEMRVLARRRPRP